MERLIEDFNATVHNGRLTNAQIDFLRTSCGCDEDTSSEEDQDSSSSECEFPVTNARIKLSRATNGKPEGEHD